MFRTLLKETNNSLSGCHRKLSLFFTFLFAALLLCPITVLANGPVPEPGQPHDSSAGLLFGLFFFLFILFIAVSGTVLIEFLAAIPFRLKPIWWVLPVNFVSNLVFNILLFIFVVLAEVPYVVYVPIGEVIVVAVEYLVYRKLYPKDTPKQILIYTVTANLLSALSVLLGWKLIFS